MLPVPSAPRIALRASQSSTAVNLCPDGSVPTPPSAVGVMVDVTTNDRRPVNAGGADPSPASTGPVPPVDPTLPAAPPEPATPVDPTLPPDPTAPPDPTPLPVPMPP